MTPLSASAGISDEEAIGLIKLDPGTSGRRGKGASDSKWKEHDTGGVQTMTIGDDDEDAKAGDDEDLFSGLLNTIGVRNGLAWGDMAWYAIPLTSPNLCPPPRPVV